MPDPLVDSIVSLGFDLWSMKLYWVAISALWFYDYFLTLESEVKYGWTGRKSTVFWVYILNRYFAPCTIIITLAAYFAKGWDLDVCTRYGFMETLETMILTFTAEVFLTLRVYALLKSHKAVPIVSGIIICWQWAIALYAMSQSSKGTDQPALLLSRDLPPLPPIPDIDPFHVCIFISTLTVTPWVEAFLCLSLAFDCLVFITIICVTYRSTRNTYFTQLLRVIQRDGIIYFFVLFSSNLIWLLLLLHARPGLKFMHNQPAMVISSIMINRITLNLKEASARHSVMSWSIHTFRPLDISSYDDTLAEDQKNVIELRHLPSPKQTLNV